MFLVSPVEVELYCLVQIRKPTICNIEFSASDHLHWKGCEILNNKLLACKYAWGQHVSSVSKLTRGNNDTPMLCMYSFFLACLFIHHWIYFLVAVILLPCWQTIHTCVPIVKDCHPGVGFGGIKPDCKVSKFRVVNSLLRTDVNRWLVFSRTCLWEQFVPVLWTCRKWSHG